MTGSSPPRVVLTNDDGPPGPDSPYIYGLYLHLTQHLGWNVKVVIPSSQKSWIGKAYQIKDIVHGRYFYPCGPDGTGGEISETSRPLKEGETTEWVLFDATPATCANIALHNLFRGEVDLLISGPNYGRNSSAAFALSSGTIGAALSSSLSGIRSIALSYGTFGPHPPKECFEPAHLLSCRIIKYLWGNWGTDDGGLRNDEVDLYNVNIPMIKQLLDEQGLRIYWTKIFRNTYGRLFKAHPTAVLDTSAAGPDSAHLNPTPNNPPTPTVDGNKNGLEPLVFKFSPDISGLINPPLSSLPVGSDAWAISNGHVSVTPLRASFAEPEGFTSTLVTQDVEAEHRLWKVRL